MNGDPTNAQLPTTVQDLLARLENSPFAQWRNSIAKIESGGQKQPYSAVVTNPNGQRALGKYQVMEGNVPGWTKDAFGKSMTPEEFLANPDAQEAVFLHRFGGYVQKYGNPQDAASAWFTGGPLAYGADKADKFGTTGNSYVAKFNRNLDGVAPPAPRLPAAPSAPALPPSTVQGSPIARSYPQHGLDMNPTTAAAIQALPTPQNPNFFQRNTLMQRDPVSGDFIDPRGAALAGFGGT